MPFDPYFGTLSDDELLSMGQEAGYLPSPEPDAVPGVAAAIPAPGQQYPPPAPVQHPAMPQGLSGVGTSYRGIGSDDKYNRITGKEKTGVDLEMAAASRDAAAGAIPSLQAATGSAAVQAEAAKRQANATVDKIHAQGREALTLQRLQDEFAVEETKANAEAHAQSNQAKMDYLAALADFRAAKVDPAQLWGNMSGGERFGMLATAFVHDFLGARGINTTAMATFNKAIDRNIDAQLQGIKTKGEVAEGFKSLWYMQRNQSASDTEARARVRGFMLEGAKQQIIANMSQYESALASAQGQAAIAEIDKELSKSLIDIYRHTDQNAIALRNQALEKWKAKLSAWTEQQSLNMRQKELDAKKKENEDSIEPLYDPESGKALWYFPKWIQKEERAKARESFEGVDEVNESLKELRELTRKAAPVFDPIGGTRFADTDQQKFDALATRVAHGMAKANGERATDKDVEQFMTGFRRNSWFNSADAEKVIAATQAQVLRAAKTKTRAVTKDLPEELQGAFGTRAAATPFQGDSIESKATANPPAKTTDEIHAEEALKTSAGTPGQTPLTEEEISAPVKKAHDEAARQYPHLFTREQTVGEAMHGKNAPQPAPIRKYERSMVELRRLAARKRHDGVPDDKNPHIAQLKQLAGNYLNSGISDDTESVFAALMLQTIDEEE